MSNNNHTFNMSIYATNKTLQLPFVTNTPHILPTSADEEDSGNESDYSLDYEFPGPRFANYRPTHISATTTNNNNMNDLDDAASELSFNDNDNSLTLHKNDDDDDDDDDVDVDEEDDDTADVTVAAREGIAMRDAEIEDIHIDRDDDTSQPMFDMWDDDPYNDFTWESNDMQLTKFMKRKVKQLKAQQQQQHPSSFWNKSKEWPKQLPYSCSSTNHDQSANAICLVQSNYGIKEKIYAVYRDRIIECGKSPPTHTFAVQNNSCHGNNQSRETTWIEGVDSSHSRHGNHVHNRHKFLTTHQSISLSKTSQMPTSTMANDGKKEDDDDQLINKFKPYSKFIKRKDYSHGLQREHAYLSLGFDPQCLAIKYGYMAIGGVEGEFELYCCMKQNEQPIKIWGTKFKGNNNVMLMTNAIQIIRLKNTVTGQYEHMLIACMNEAGLLVYQLPSHHQCQHMLASGGLNQRNKYHQSMVTLHSHLRSFQGVPINDAKLSPDGTNIVCVGDDSMIFMIDVYTCAKSGKIQLGTPRNIVIPTCLLQQPLEKKSSNTAANTMNTSTTTTSTATTTNTTNTTTNASNTTLPAQLTTSSPSTTTPAPSLPSTASSTSPFYSLPYSSQYVAWSPSSKYFAHTSDSHNLVFIWKASTQEIIYTIDAVGYSYAIAFHPHLDHILVFTNRYGYFHTVDLSKVSSSPSLSSSTPSSSSSSTSSSPSVTSLATTADSNNTNILHFNPSSRDHTCIDTCILSTTSANINQHSLCTNNHAASHSNKQHTIFHTRHLDRVQHEITMVSFRGEVDTRLRILAKINGIEWSKDGKYLYVATKKRVLAYQFLKTQHTISSLLELTSRQMKRVFEEEEHKHNADEARQDVLPSSKRMKYTHNTPSTDNITIDTNATSTSTSNSFLKTWNSFLIPYHLHYRVIGQNDQLACHW